MKKSRITKLALSGAAVAALAATFSTSTYAWYVSNKTANVNAVTGSTAAGTSDNTISVSLTGARNDYHKTIEIANKTYGLNPVLRQNATLDATGAKTAAYYALNEAGSNVVLKSTAESTGYYEYVIYMLASVNCTVAPVLSITNTTTDFSTLKQVNYSGGKFVYTALTSAVEWEANKYYVTATKELTTAEPEDFDTNYANYSTRAAEASLISDVDSGASFTVDALNAMAISLAVETGAFASNADDAAYQKADTTTLPTEYANKLTDSSAVLALTGASGTGFGSVHATAGAHAYYEFMTSKTLDSTTKVSYATSKTALTSISLTAGVPVRLYYSLWLDGSYDVCFNACQGQTVSVAFDYTATPAA